MKGGGALAPKYTHRQKYFFDNFRQGRVNKYDYLGKFFLFRAVEGFKKKKIDTDFRNSFPGLSYRSPKYTYFSLFAIFIKFGLPYLGRYESCPDIITAIDRQLDVLMNRQCTELYS